jgi:hypothetical protein
MWCDIYGLKSMGFLLNMHMRLSEFPSLIQEGGNIFKTPQGGSATTKIDRADIVPTLKLLEPALGIPLVDAILGSAGKKAQSGDIDISVDATQITKDALTQKLKQWVQSVHQQLPDDWVKKSGISVHFKMPIRNDPAKGYVQIDFMFDPDPTWMKFSMYSAGDASAYSGADRNMLMSSIAKAQGMKYSWQKGLIRREDEALISKDPDTIAQKLLGPQFDHTALLSVETIQSALDDRSDLKAQLLQLADNLESDHAPDGTPIKPGQLRVNQEEAARIRRLIGS